MPFVDRQNLKTDGFTDEKHTLKKLPAEIILMKLFL
jgi:hypothetical protein